MGREFSIMHSIYKNATVVIAAEFPTNVHQGFLEQPLKEAIKLPFGHEEGLEGNVHLAPDSRIVEIEALNTRAWVFQEAVLARRLLIYSRKGVRWSCISDHIQPSAFEPHRMTYLVEQITGSRGVFGHPDHGRMFQHGYNATWGDFLDSWHRMIESYTLLSLTFSHDRLPAFAGIAKEFQSMITGEYVAGVWISDEYDTDDSFGVFRYEGPRLIRESWANDIGRQLAWSRTHNSPALHATEEYQAPSWSWAAAMGGVRFRNYYGPKNEDLRIQVISHRTECFYETAPFGRVKSGSLEVEAFLCALKDVPFSWLKFTAMDRLPSNTQMNMEANPQNGDIPCMILGCGQWNVVGLFLEPVGDGTYRRIGLFQGDWGDGLSWPESAEDLPKGATKQRLNIV
jgi:hypothetical protein